MSEERTGGKRSCKHYHACGTRENCSRCTAVEWPKGTSDRQKRYPHLMVDGPGGAS